MIVDLITNSKEVADFVKEKEGGRIVKVSNGYRLVNIPIGYKKYFNREILDFIREKNLSKRALYTIITPKYYRNKI